MHRHPGVQRIGDRLGSGLADMAARMRIELLHFALDIVELSEVLECLPGELAVVVRVQIEELAPGVREAPAFDHALGEQRLVAGPASNLLRPVTRKEIRTMSVMQAHRQFCVLPVVREASSRKRRHAECAFCIV